MTNNIIIKLLLSIPVILVVIYFIPFLGGCLLLLRYFLYFYKRKETTIWLFIVSFVILLPKIVGYITNYFNLNIKYLDSILDSNIYNLNLISYSRLLIILAIIYYLIFFLYEMITSSIKSKINNFISEERQDRMEAYQKNDLIMQEKREKAKHTSYVKCPYCGSDNLVSDKFGVCKYCRRKLENKNYKEE